jgi:hypothetical protein
VPGSEYHLDLVEPGPLPPHERSWRHPSELGPTRVDVEDSGSRHQLAALVTGGAMMVALAVMVVAVTPRSSSTPVAINATTTPDGPVATAAAAMPVPVPAGIVSASARVFVEHFSASPHAITSSPELTLDGADVASEAPLDDDIVRVRTDAVTYELPWAMVEALRLTDGSVVFDGAGGIVAHVTRGELVALAGD